MATKNEIKVKVDAKKLAVYTIKTTGSLDKFPKKYRFTLVDKLVNCSLEIVSNIEDANSYSGETRRHFQTQAISNCEKMKTYLAITMTALKPKCGTFEWNKMIETVEDQLKKWRKSTT